MKNWLRKQLEDFQELCEIIGLKNSAQQLAVGAALGLILLLACGVAEWISRQY